MGVARCSVGRGGLAAAGWLPTALALGEGGIAKPSLGVRGPPLLLPPGRAGRKRGAGAGVKGRTPGDVVELAFEGRLGSCRAGLDSWGVDVGWSAILKYFDAIWRGKSGWFLRASCCS
jgi:hypothetical protein